MKSIEKTGSSVGVGSLERFGGNTIQNWAEMVMKKDNIASSKQVCFLAIAKAFGEEIAKIPEHLRSKKGINIVLEATCRKLLYYKDNKANALVDHLPEDDLLRGLYANILGKFGTNKDLRIQLNDVFEHTGVLGGFFQNRLNFDAGYTNTANKLR